MTPARLSVAIFVLLSAVVVAAAEAPRPRSILVLLSGDAANPNGTLFVQGFRDALPALTDLSKPPFIVYVEFLDLHRFGSYAGYSEQVRAAFIHKYQQRDIDVIVTLYSAATHFAVDVRDSLWPDVPIVAAGLSPSQFNAENRPRRLTGWLMPNGMAGLVRMIDRALPGTDTLVLVSGSSEVDREWMRVATTWLERAAPDRDLIILAELPVNDLLTQLKTLPANSAVIILSYLIDGNGRPIGLSSMAHLISETSNRPIFTPGDAALGTGVLGVYGVPTTTIGARACEVAQRLLEGADPEVLKYLPPPPFVAVFDERQLKRWDVPESRLPEGAKIVNRGPNLWRDHPALVATVVIALVGLSALVVILTIERRRRIRAQFESHQQLIELSAMNRRAALGELSASIAHEINQPLGAIMNNAEAARLMLERPDPPIEDIRTAVVAIRDDDRRASDIVRGIRAIVARGEFEETPIDMRALLMHTLSILDGDLRLSGVRVIPHFAQVAPAAGDRVYLQQVLINVIMNALDAMRGVAERLLVVRTFETAEGIAMSVSDSGTGFSPDALRRAFEPFFTTKGGESGMGMGLAISRRIVEAHRGKLVLKNNERGSGATVTIVVPRMAEERARRAPAAGTEMAVPDR